MRTRMFLCMALFLAGGIDRGWAAREMSVQVREGQLRSAPSFLSRVQELLPYTQRVTVLETSGDWLRVQPIDQMDQQGWMHNSALTPKKLALTAGEIDAGTTVTTEEQALAGKGFSAEVEAEYKERNAELRFDWVDRMEQTDVPIDAIQRFLVEGGLLVQQEGGVK